MWDLSGVCISRFDFSARGSAAFVEFPAACILRRCFHRDLAETDNPDS